MTGELAAVVIAVIGAGIVLLKLRQRRLWPAVYIARGWYGEDAVNLGSELSRHGIRVRVVVGREPGAGWLLLYAPRPRPREVTVFWQDVPRAKPIVQAWADRYWQEQKAKEELS